MWGIVGERTVGNVSDIICILENMRKSLLENSNGNSYHYTNLNIILILH